MKFPDLKNKKVTIMGLGLLGRGLNDAKFFAKNGAKVTVTDLKSKKELKSSLDELKDLPVKYTLGKHKKEDFENADLVIRNAAVPKDSEFLKIAKKAGAEIEMDESFFAKYCPCPIIGITGTRGKTTTSTLIAEILKLTGKTVYLAGNIQGKATLPLIDKVGKYDLAVLELSSWQLQGFGRNKISPHISVVTNIYQDHLDRYKNMEDYINDKKNIYKYQTAEDYLILNNKNSETKKMAKQSKSKILWFDSKDIPADWDLRLLGKHNKENVAAALKVADIFDLDLKKVRQVCEDFKSVKNRLEPIDEIDGVLFVNDTTSTTPIATQAAIDAFDEFPIILIAGGNDKNLEIQDLAKDTANRTKGVFLLAGTGTPKFKEKIEYFGGTMIADVYENMEKCVKDAFEASEVGDVILLSPGFSSFGLFKNEFDRGEQFKKAVKKLKTKEKGRGDKEIATQFGKVLWGRHGSTEIDKADIR